MYQVPVRFSSDSESNRRGGFWFDNRFAKREGRMRPRARRSRRYLLYAGLLAGFCLLLAFVGCGATAGIGELKPGASDVNFGAVTVGHVGTATVSFTNSGAGAVQVSGVTVTGQPFKFAGSGSFPVMVAAGATYSFPVQFIPSSAGSATGEATVNSNVSAGGLPTVSLTGMGVSAATTTAAGVLSGISCNNSSMVGSGTDNCFVALNAPAGSGGATVNLESSSTAVTVPATVTIPANTTGVGFAAKVSAVSTSQSTVLTATEAGVSESFALELNAALRILSASAGHVSFGYVTLNSTATQSVILTSSGTEPVTIQATSLSGAAFNIGGLALPVALNPGQVIVLNVEFDPATAGSATGQLTITTNSSSGRSMVIGLSGTGAASSGSSGGSGGGGSGGTTAVPAALACGSSSMTGSGTDSCIVTLNAAAPASGVGVTLASNNAAVTVPATVTVPSGAVSAGFTASAAAVTTAQTATLTATANGAAQTFALQLNAAGAFLSASQAAVAFGNISLNALGTQTLILASTGTQAVTISAAVLTGSGFTMSGIAPPMTLNPGQSVTLELQFIPTIAGSASGQIAISSSATTGGTMLIPLTGTGSVPYQVNLAWDAPGTSTDPVAGYNVYRSLTGASAYQLLNAAADATTTFTDTTVVSGQSYVYYVTSVDGSGVESTPSNAFDVAIP
jgi:Abnormal spindle-like microcephaly-assoc'd, ASPM-SPD-2-Hydin